MHRVRVLGLIAAVAVLSIACGNETDSAQDSSDPASTNAFVLDEWSIRPADLASGSVAVTATNVGTESHELILVHGSDPTQFATKPDGSVDEDRIPEADLVGEIPDVAAGESVTKTFDLAPGDYVAVCNVVDEMGMGDGGTGHSGMGGAGDGGMGHVHYELGMVTTFTIT